MTENSVRKIITLLQELPAGRGSEWTEDTTVVYAAMLSRIHDRYAPMIMNYVLTECEWRPAPAGIYKFVSREIGKSLCPSTDTLISSIRDAIIMHDMKDERNRKKVPPALNRIVESIGGWRRLSAMDSDRIDAYITDRYRQYVEEICVSDVVSEAMKTGGEISAAGSTAMIGSKK